MIILSEVIDIAIPIGGCTPDALVSHSIRLFLQRLVRCGVVATEVIAIEQVQRAGFAGLDQ